MRHEMNAERAGLKEAAFRNLWINGSFCRSSLDGMRLRSTSPSSSFPVVTSCGGVSPGQNRDKFWSAKSSHPTATIFAFAAICFGLCIVAGIEDHLSSHNEQKTNSGGEKAKKLARVRAEVAEVLADYHSKISRKQARAIAAIYARYSSRDQDSVADQVKKMLADALQRNLYVPAEFVFFDLSVRGFKNDRAGLNGLRACLEAKSVQVAMFFATNRLFRKTYRSLQFVEEQIVERGIRGIFVKSGVDTSDGKRWRSLLNMHASMDEFVVTMYVDNIHAAHEGLLEKALVFGTISFGFRGEPIPNVFTRRGRPRRQLVINGDTAAWVRQIFRWYVTERLPIVEIVRRLNADPGVPRPPKSRTGRWSRGAVIYVLSNARYRGEWRYGSTETVWLSSKDYARQVKRDEPLKQVQIEELRLVEDATWYAAAKLLAEEAAKAVGRKPVDEDVRKRPRLLHGLFWCPKHGKLYVGGANGKSLFCKVCRELPVEERTLFSLLPRDVALEKTCGKIAELILQDAELPQRIVEACQSYAAQQQAPDPKALTFLLAQRGKIDQQINFIIRNPGDTDADILESETALRHLRKQRSGIDSEIAILQAAKDRAIEIPSVEAVKELMADLVKFLSQAATASVDQAGLVRELIDLCTGGRIELYQCGERIAKRGWLEGRFPNMTFAAISRKLTGVALDQEGGEDIIIEYRRDPDELSGTTRELILKLYRDGILIKEIARRTGVNRNRIASFLKDWHATQGFEMPDGRTRRSTLGVKHLQLPDYQAIADRVKQLADEGLPFGTIAEMLDRDKNTITSAWKFWHQSRSLAVPDGRNRRKELRLRREAS